MTNGSWYLTRCCHFDLVRSTIIQYFYLYLYAHRECCIQTRKPSTQPCDRLLSVSYAINFFNRSSMKKCIQIWTSYYDHAPRGSNTWAQRRGMRPAHRTLKIWRNMFYVSFEASPRRNKNTNTRNFFIRNAGLAAVDVTADDDREMLLLRHCNER